MQRWGTLQWAEEKGQIEKGVWPFLRKRQLERKIYNYRKSYATAGGDKAARAQPIRGRMAMGKVYVRRAPRGRPIFSGIAAFPGR